jgi:hypothetical protein
VADEEEEPDMRRVEPWWTSLPAGNMKRRSCQGGEDMVGEWSVDWCVCLVLNR